MLQNQAKIISTTNFSARESTPEQILTQLVRGMEPGVVPGGRIGFSDICGGDSSQNIIKHLVAREPSCCHSVDR